MFHFEISSLFGPETQAKLVAVNPPGKKLKKTVTQPPIKLNDWFSCNSDIQMLKLGEKNSVLQERHRWWQEAPQERAIASSSSLQGQEETQFHILSCFFHAISWNGRALTHWEPSCTPTPASSSAYHVPPNAPTQTHLLKVDSPKACFTSANFYFPEASCLLNLVPHPQAGVQTLKIAGVWQRLDSQDVSTLKYLAERSVCSSAKCLHLDRPGSYCCYASL